MLFEKELKQAGEYPFQFKTQAGSMEGMLLVPEQVRDQVVAILGHPHSLQGGSMNNKVVTTMARVFRDLGIASLRFNFRGVGNSEGQYDEGRGESEDMICLHDLWQKTFPESACFFAGFSFGSYVAYRAANQRAHQALISIAPPVHHYDYLEYKPSPAPWIIVQGEEDEVVPETIVKDFLQWHIPEPQYLLFPETGHFFHGKLGQLKEQLTAVLKQQLKQQ